MLKGVFVAQVQSLKEKIFGLKGTKRPNLKKVKKTTDDMLGACSDPSKLMKPDFKAKLKTVKKEDEKVTFGWKQSSIKKNKLYLKVHLNNFFLYLCRRKK